MNIFAIFVVALPFTILTFPAFAEPTVGAGATGNRGDLEIVTDSGEKFHLVHANGTNFDVIMEANGQKIGTANVATGETAASGPDYATNGAAMGRAKAAYLQPGHVHTFDPSEGTPQNATTLPVNGGAAPPQSSPASPTVVSYDAATASATIQTAAGAVKFTDKGDNFEIQVKDGITGRMLTIHGHYVSADNAGQKAKNGLRSLTFSMATGVISRQMYIGPAVELYVNDGERDGPKSAYGLDGIAKDMGVKGAGMASATKWRFEPVAGSVSAAARAYETASGRKLAYIPFLDAVARLNPATLGSESVSPH